MVWLIVGLLFGVAYFAFREAIHKSFKAISYELGWSKDDGGGECESRY